MEILINWHNYNTKTEKEQSEKQKQNVICNNLWILLCSIHYFLWFYLFTLRAKKKFHCFAMDNKVLLLQCSQKYLLYKKTTKQRYLQLLFQLLLNQFSRFCHGDVYKIKTPVNNLDVLRVSSEGSDIRTFLSRNVTVHSVNCNYLMWQKTMNPSI